MNWTQSSWKRKGGEGVGETAGQLVRVKLGMRKEVEGRRGGIPPGAAFPRHVGYIGSCRRRDKTGTDKGGQRTQRKSTWPRNSQMVRKVKQK